MFTRATLALLLAFTTVSVTYASDTFIKPTAEELAMKELPGYPGAAAVVCFMKRSQETTSTSCSGMSASRSSPSGARSTRTST